ncbi:hypothetical protein PYCC9005_005367 [Savitreella phatthalungensis]
MQVGEVSEVDYELLNSLDRLRPLGVVRGSIYGLAGPEPEAPDGWQWLPTWHEFPEEYRYLQILQALGLIRLTYKIEKATLKRKRRCTPRPGATCRVYAVPEDVSPAKARLNSTGRAAIRKLLEIDHCEDAWKGKPCEHGPSPSLTFRHLQQYRHHA